MALILLNTSAVNYGQFDGYDGLSSTLLGGEIATLVAYQNTGADKHAKDIDDGYVTSGSTVPASGQFRPVVTTTFATGGAALRPLFLTDDGTGAGTNGSGYGTLFGTVVGSNAGQTVTGGTVLGPSTMSGSGKVTLWASQGLYGVSLDALDTAADGVTPSNIALTVGTHLTWGANGKITPVGSTLALAFPGAANTTVIANLVEFSTGDGLVNTPKSLTRIGIAGGMLSMKMAVINFAPPVAS